jgi:hypothetical protein
LQENKKRWTVEKDLLNLKRAMGEIIKARIQITKFRKLTEEALLQHYEG